jgi:hypothetical protein
MNIEQLFSEITDKKLYAKVVRKGKMHYRKYRHELKNGKGVSATTLLVQNLYRSNPFFNFLIKKLKPLPKAERERLLNGRWG